MQGLAIISAFPSDGVPLIVYVKKLCTVKNMSKIASLMALHISSFSLIEWYDSHPKKSRQ